MVWGRSACSLDWAWEAIATPGESRPIGPLATNGGGFRKGVSKRKAILKFPLHPTPLHKFREVLSDEGWALFEDSTQ